jgi:hypothetical protein
MKTYNSSEIINAVINENAKLIQVYGVYSYYMLEFSDGSHTCKLRKGSPQLAQDKMKSKTTIQPYNGSYRNGRVVFKP